MSVAIYREDGLASSTAVKGPCRAATTANISLEGEQTLDGVACVTGDRVLVKDQTDGVENGIYIVDTGTWRRSADFEGNRDVRKGTRVGVNSGTTYALTDFLVTTNDPITIDETAIVFELGAAFQAQAAVDAAVEGVEEDAEAADASRIAAEAAQAAAEAALASVVSLLEGRVGVIDWFSCKEAPSGWLAADGSAVSRTTYSALFALLVTAAGFSAQTFTVTIASPAVFTKSSHGFNGGERIRLSTSSALPTGLDTTTDYYVKYLNANTFEVSTTFGGASVDTSGTQAGTHTYLQSLWGLGDGSTTFNLPLVNDDERLVASAGTGRQVGTSRAESIGPHTHDGTTGDDDPDHDHDVIAPDSRHGANGVTNLTSIRGGNGDQVDTDDVSLTSEGANNKHQHPFTTDANSGTVNLPPTIALLACVYTGVA